MRRKRLYIEDSNQEAVFLAASVTKESLFRIISYNCILLCRKCGREDFCVFVERKIIKAEEPCAFATTILRNCLNYSYPIFRKCNNSDKQSFLFWLSEFIKAVSSLENRLGMMLNKGILEWLGDDMWAAQSFVHSSREAMDLLKANEYTNNIRQLRYKQKIYFVEGETEVLFLKGLNKGRSIHFQDLESFNYEGKDNINHLRPLLRDVISRGMHPIIIADGDGEPLKRINRLGKLIKEGLIDRKDIFVFQNDFEMSFPERFLYFGYRTYKKFVRPYQNRLLINEDVLDAFIATIGKKTDKKLFLKLKSLKKPILGHILGMLMALYMSRFFNRVVNKPGVFEEQHEIFNLIRFIVTGSINIPVPTKIN